MNTISGAVLSGGESSRMGTDKAFLKLEGKFLIEHSIELLQPFFNEVIISANTERYKVFGFKVVNDEFPGFGPLSGIFSVLKNSKNPWTLIISCDTPFLSGAIIKRLIKNTGDYNCVIPVCNGKKEPLVALYHKNCLPAISTNIKKGIYKMHFLLETLNCNYIDVLDLVSENPNLFANINSQSDYAEFIAGGT